MIYQIYAATRLIFFNRRNFTEKLGVYYDSQNIESDAKFLFNEENSVNVINVSFPREIPVGMHSVEMISEVHSEQWIKYFHFLNEISILPMLMNHELCFLMRRKHKKIRNRNLCENQYVRFNLLHASECSHSWAWWHHKIGIPNEIFLSDERNSINKFIRERQIRL